MELLSCMPTWLGANSEKLQGYAVILNGIFS